MNIIPLFVILPLGGAFVNSVFGKRYKGFSDIFASVVSLMLLALSVYAVVLVNKCGTMVYKIGMWIPPIGVGLVLDGLSAFMLFTVNLITFFIMLYSVNYMEKYTAKWKFYTLVLLMLAGMEGVVVTGDMFNLFVFLEIASVASYALVAFGTEAEELEAQPHIDPEGGLVRVDDEGLLPGTDAELAHDVIAPHGVVVGEQSRIVEAGDLTDGQGQLGRTGKLHLTEPETWLAGLGGWGSGDLGGGAPELGDGAGNARGNVGRAADLHVQPGPALGRHLAVERLADFMLGLRPQLGEGQLLGTRAQAVANIVAGHDEIGALIGDAAHQ